MYAECGGLMYLGRSLSDLDGKQYPMVGAIPVVSSMEGRRLHLGYREVAACGDGPLLTSGQQVRGHEFHWSVLQEPPDAGSAAYQVVNQEGRPEGFRSGSVWASYIHVHLGSRPGVGETVRGYLRGGGKGRVSEMTTPQVQTAPAVVVNDPEPSDGFRGYLLIPLSEFGQSLDSPRPGRVV